MAIKKNIESCNRIILDLWSMKHYGWKIKNKNETHIYEGSVKTDTKSIMFHSAGQFLKAIEDLYFEMEKKR